MNFRFYVLVFIVFTFLFSCGEDKTTNPVDNNIESVTIGSQVWMKKNLNVDHYRNGDSIPEVRDSVQWINLTTGAWCYYKNDSSFGVIYGKLYNWYAVTDPRGLSPVGWHVSSDMEWNELEHFLGNSSIAGGKLKSNGTIESGEGLWNSPNIGASNESLFSAYPGGYRHWYQGIFYELGKIGTWWTSTKYTDKTEWMRVLYYDSTLIRREHDLKVCGFSVRCIKD